MWLLSIAGDDRESSPVAGVAVAVFVVVLSLFGLL